MTYKAVIEAALAREYGNRRTMPPSAVWNGLDGANRPARWILRTRPGISRGQTETLPCTVKWAKVQGKDSLEWISLHVKQAEQGLVRGTVGR